MYGPRRFASISMPGNSSGDSGYICLFRSSVTRSELALYSEGELVFWKALAIVAVFHFVRQQYGWVALYRRKLGETEGWTWWIDAAAVYLATIYPLAFWMTSLPRNFNWFVENDFFGLPEFTDEVIFPIYVIALTAYFAKSIYLYATKGFLNIGKDIVVATTAVCWYVGIVFFNSDYAFTVTNVIIHGVPYFALIYVYARLRREQTGPVYRTLSQHWIVFLATLWAIAYVEELFWNRGIWHEKQWLFGADWDWTGLKIWIERAEEDGSSLLAPDEPMPTGEEIGRQFEQFLAGLDGPEDPQGGADQERG